MTKADTPLTVITTPYVGELTKLSHVLKEWGRVYRAMRKGDIPAAEATRLIYALDIGARMVRAHEELQLVADQNALAAKIIEAQGLQSLPHPAENSQVLAVMDRTSGESE